MINRLVVKYRSTRNEIAFRKLYEELSDEWSDKRLQRESTRLGVDKHDLAATYQDSLLKCIDTYDGSKPFINYFRAACTLEKRKLQRDTYRRNNRYSIEDAATFDVPDEIDIEENAIKKKEADKRQLINFLLQSGKTDPMTTAIVKEYLKNPSATYTSTAKLVGTYRNDVKRRLLKLSSRYDANRFGDIQDYLAV